MWRRDLVRCVRTLFWVEATLHERKSMFQVEWRALGEDYQAQECDVAVWSPTETASIWAAAARRAVKQTTHPNAILRPPSESWAQLHPHTRRTIITLNRHKFYSTSLVLHPSRCSHTELGRLRGYRRGTVTCDDPTMKSTAWFFPSVKCQGREGQSALLWHSPTRFATVNSIEEIEFHTFKWFSIFVVRWLKRVINDFMLRLSEN